jgi:hypothetical protein
MDLSGGIGEAAPAFQSGIGAAAVRSPMRHDFSPGISPNQSDRRPRTLPRAGVICPTGCQTIFLSSPPYKNIPVFA